MGSLTGTRQWDWGRAVVIQPDSSKAFSIMFVRGRAVEGWRHRYGTATRNLGGGSSSRKRMRRRRRRRKGTGSRTGAAPRPWTRSPLATTGVLPPCAGGPSNSAVFPAAALATLAPATILSGSEIILHLAICALGVSLTGGLKNGMQRLPARCRPELEGLGQVVLRSYPTQERLLVLRADAG